MTESIKKRALSLGHISSISLGILLILFGQVITYSVIACALSVTNTHLPLVDIVHIMHDLPYYSLIPQGIGVFAIAITLLKSNRKIDISKTQLQIRKISVIGIAALLMVSAFFVATPITIATGFTTTATRFLEDPLPIAKAYVGQYTNDTYFFSNGATWNTDVIDANKTVVELAAINSITDGNIWSQVPFDYEHITIPENISFTENVNGVQRVFGNIANSQGSPMTISAGADADDGQYFAEDRKGTIVFTSTNRTYVMQRCVDVLAVSGGLIITDDVQWDRTIILPNNVGVTQQYAGQIEQIGASQPTYPRISKMDFYPYATLPDGSFIAWAGYPYIRLVSDEKQTVNKTLAGAITYFESQPRASFVTSAGTLLVDCESHPNNNMQGLLRCPNASFNTLASDFTWTLNVRSYDTGSGHIWGLDQDKKGNIYAGWYFGGGVAGVGAVIFVSRDDGITWNIAYNSTNGAHIHNVRVDPYTDYVYAAIGGDAPGGTASIVRSKDCGVTWETILNGTVQCVGIGFSSNARYFGVDSFDSRRTIIYRTTDDATYETVLNGSSTQSVYCFDIIESKGYLFASTCNAFDGGNEGGLYYSVDDGLSWEKLLNTIGTINHAGISDFTKGHDGTLYFIDGGYGVNNFYKISFEHQPTKIIVDGKDQIINGTWINHHFGMKLENIQLTLMNNTYVNSTCYYLHPTVINNLPDGFQVSLLMVKDGEVIPVTSTTDTVYVMWMARR